MIHKIFSIYDSKAVTYNTPIFLPQEGQAIRIFDDMVNRTDSEIGKHPEDYTLFTLGDFNDETGLITSLNTPKSLGTALEFVK